MTGKPSKTLNYEKAALSDLRLVRCAAGVARCAAVRRRSLRIDFFGSSDNKKYLHHPWENAVKIGIWSGKTKIAIISSKNLFRPQF